MTFQNRSIHCVLTHQLSDLCICKMLRKMTLNKICDNTQWEDTGCMINYYNRAVVPSDNGEKRK